MRLGPKALFTYANNDYHPTASLGYVTSTVGPDAPAPAPPVPTPSWLYWQQPYETFPFAAAAAANASSCRWGVSIQDWSGSEMAHTITRAPYIPAGNLDTPAEWMQVRLLIFINLQQSNSVLLLHYAILAPRLFRLMHLLKAPMCYSMSPRTICFKCSL